MINKKISIIMPVFNEEKNVVVAYNKINDFFISQLKNFEYEIIFTDNHSEDKTQQILEDLCEKDKKVKYIRFKFNLGYDKSLLQGYKQATGDAAIVIDSDLQDPPELFKYFIEKWLEGYDLVYGIRERRKESKFFSNLRVFYYKIMHRYSFSKFPIGAGDFRLVDKSIIDNFRDNKESYPYMRGITFSLSKRSIGIKYDRVNRLRGESKYNYFNALRYALNALIEESFLLNKIFNSAFLFLILFVFLLFIIDFFNHFIDVYLMQIFNLIFLIFLALRLTFVSEYLDRIYLTVKNKKTNIFEKKINC